MTKSERTIAILEIITSVGLILFWTAFFTIGMAPKNPPPCYFVFEHSFPFPDVILAIGLLTGSIMMLKGRAGGRRLSLLCAGGLIFLGLLDMSFNFQNGMYSISVADMMTNGFINLWCIGFGISIALCISIESD